MVIIELLMFYERRGVFFYFCSGLCFCLFVGGMIFMLSENFFGCEEVEVGVVGVGIWGVYLVRWGDVRFWIDDGWGSGLVCLVILLL